MYPWDTHAYQRSNKDLTAQRKGLHALGVGDSRIYGCDILQIHRQPACGVLGDAGTSMAFLGALVSRYFVHHPPTATVEPFYWRSLSGFADQPIHINLNLLAHVLGDSPTAMEETIEPGGGGWCRSRTT